MTDALVIALLVALVALWVGQRAPTTVPSTRTQRQARARARVAFTHWRRA